MRALLVAALLLPAVVLAVEPYTTGDTLPATRFDDQHGLTHTLHEHVRVIVFSHDMEGGDVIKAALADDGPRLLGDAGAVYVADVSGMPTVIRRMFALPKMRKRTYPMLLDTDGDATARYPARPAQATVIVLDRLRVTSIQHHPDVVGLRESLVTLATVPESARDE